MGASSTPTPAPASDAGTTPPSTTPTTTAPAAADYLQQAAQVSPQGTSSSDQQLVASVLAAMHGSATAGRVADQLVANRIPVQVLDDARFQQIADGAVALYQRSSKTIILPRSLVQSDPVVVAATLAHEGTHALIDKKGLLMSAVTQAAAGVRQGDQAGLAQAEWEIDFADEVAAHRIEAQAGIELGLRPPAGHPAVDPATGQVRDFATTWRAFEVSPQYSTYNPQGRRASDADIARYASMFGTAV